MYPAQFNFMKNIVLRSAAFSRLLNRFSFTANFKTSILKMSSASVSEMASSADPIVLFTVRKSKTQTASTSNADHTFGNVADRGDVIIENVTDTESITNQFQDSPDTILCILWKNFKIGAAYYKISESQVRFSLLQTALFIKFKSSQTKCIYCMMK